MNERPKNVGIAIGSNEFTCFALIDRPEHCAILGRIFTSWSIIEATVTATLGVFIDAPSEVTIPLLSTFSSNRGRVEAVRKVAKEVLDDQEFREFNSLMNDTVAYSKQRNEVAHYLWGKNADQPDVILRLPMSAIATVCAYVPDVPPSELIDDLQRKIVPFTIGQLEQIEQTGAALLVRLMADLAKWMELRAEANS